MAGPLADFVLSLDVNGRITGQGSVSDTLARMSTPEDVIKQEQSTDEEVELDEVDSPKLDNAAKPADGKLVLAEEIEEGNVSKTACKNPSTVGPVWRPLTIVRAHSAVIPRCSRWEVVGCFLVPVRGSSRIVGVARQPSHMVAGLLGSAIRSPRFQRRFDWIVRPHCSLLQLRLIPMFSYLGVYGLIMITTDLFYIFGLLAYNSGTIRASRIIHYRLVSSLLGCTFRFVEGSDPYGGFES